MTFFENFKNSKTPQKHPKPQSSKIPKLIEGDHKSKKFRKQTIIRI